MRYDGYMVRVEFDDSTLTVEGTNKASRIALRGESHTDGPVVLTKDQIASVDFKPANPVANGKITVHTTDGERYILHFRRKQREGFAELYAALSS